MGLRWSPTGVAVAGGTEALTRVFSVPFVILSLSALGLAGAVMSWTPPEVT
jgi:hypothetical protein